MIISHIESGIGADTKAARLIGVGKRYPLAKSAPKNIKDVLGNFWALKDVSFTIYKGKVLGIIGRNGAGKSTLLNIIAGTLSATEGKCIARGRVLGLFNLGTGFQDELTGTENIYLNGTILGVSREELDSKINSIIDFSELGDFINMPLGSYSQGMRLRLGFSIIANLDFDILILDEILAVGDMPFQSKCFERLMDLKRAGKTLIITSQAMDLIERLCDEVVLLDHGRLIFRSDASGGITRYRALLTAEKFFVGTKQDGNGLVKETKKWADDISEWGQRLGTKEAVIESVELINRFGMRCSRIKSGDPLRIIVYFTARNEIKKPHFGVAIFRDDGVYCYGPNTDFDGCSIRELKPGKGYFVLDYYKILLAPGEYRLAVAIWDKEETIAFDYHVGCYRVLVGGDYNIAGELLQIPYMDGTNFFAKLFNLPCWRKPPSPDAALLDNRWGQEASLDGVRVESIGLLNYYGRKKDTFFTDDYVRCAVTLNKEIQAKRPYLWIGIYRDDKIYCQGAVIPARNSKSFNIVFPKFSLLPGGYNISAGIWDDDDKKFLVYKHPIHSFNMVFDRGDHGTVYLKHRWEIE